MGKKYDDYAKAVQAESASVKRLDNGPQEGPEFRQNQADAQNNNNIANALWREVLEDPEG